MLGILVIATIGLAVALGVIMQYSCAYYLQHGESLSDTQKFLLTLPFFIVFCSGTLLILYFSTQKLHS